MAGEVQPRVGQRKYLEDGGTDEKMIIGVGICQLCVGVGNGESEFPEHPSQAFVGPTP